MGQAALHEDHFTHRFLWSYAGALLDGAEDENDDPSLLLGAFALTVFAVEGYANFLGAICYAGDWVNERALFSSTGDYPGTIGKLEYLGSKLDVELDRGSRPFQTVCGLYRRRSSLVHPTHERVRKTISYEDPSQIEHGEAKVSKMVDRLFLERVRSDAVQVCDRLQAAAVDRFSMPELTGMRSFAGPVSVSGGFLVPDPPTKCPAGAGKESSPR